MECGGGWKHCAPLRYVWINDKGWESMSVASAGRCGRVEALLDAITLALWEVEVHSPPYVLFSWVNLCPFVHLLFVSLPLSSFAISFSPSFFLTHPSSTLCVYISPAVSSMGCLSSFSLALASIDAYQKFNNCSPHGRENMKKAIPVDKT